MRYFTENHVEITDRVEDGRTKIFDDHSSAYEHSKQTRGYVFRVYTRTRHNPLEAAGFAVSK